MNIQSLTRQSQKGFTIVELMIATLVFSMVLIVITIGVVHFTNEYYHGINSSTTQNTAQTAVDTISQAIQFSSNSTSATAAGSNIFCAGNKVYMFTLGKQPDSATPGLRQFDRNSSQCIAPPLASISGGKELLGNRMRLTYLQVSDVTVNPASGPVWKISMSVAYGDSDLLCLASRNSMTGGCATGDSSYAIGAAVSSTVDANDVRCKLQTGMQFCSTGAYTTLAQQRIVNN